MFVRKKRNRSGSTSVVVVSKSCGRFVEVKNFGTSSSDVEIANLCNEAQRWLSTRGGQQEIDFVEEDCRWDGLKGYLTNTDLDATSVVSEYHGL